MQFRVHARPQCLAEPAASLHRTISIVAVYGCYLEVSVVYKESSS